MSSGMRNKLAVAAAVQSSSSISVVGAMVARRLSEAGCGHSALCIRTGIVSLYLSFLPASRFLSSFSPSQISFISFISFCFTSSCHSLSSLHFLLLSQFFRYFFPCRFCSVLAFLLFFHLYFCILSSFFFYFPSSRVTFYLFLVFPHTFFFILSSFPLLDLLFFSYFLRYLFSSLFSFQCFLVPFPLIPSMLLFFLFFLNFLIFSFMFLVFFLLLSSRSAFALLLLPLSRLFLFFLPAFPSFSFLSFLTQFAPLCCSASFCGCSTYHALLWY